MLTDYHTRFKQKRGYFFRKRRYGYESSESERLKSQVAKGIDQGDWKAVESAAKKLRCLDRQRLLRSTKEGTVIVLSKGTEFVNFCEIEFRPSEPQFTKKA
jgi:hypothetical protein